MVNNTINTQQYPQSLKETKMIPILKLNKNPNDPNSYRGINLSPALAKILDKTYQIQLTEHLIENQLLSQHHHGNVRGASTTTALLTLIDTWSQALDKGIDMLTLLVDQSAAFDIVEHKTLIRKLNSIGLSGDSLSLITDYLHNRKQTVSVETFTSDYLHMNPLSVIQGSGLSCIFYLIYTMDLPIIFNDDVKTTIEDAANTKYTDATTYVDDTTINMYKQVGIPLQQMLDDTIFKLEQYMYANKLVMNTEKTQFMIISKHRDRYRDVKILAEPKNVLGSSNIKLLGLEIAEDLKFNHYLIDSKLSVYKQLTTRLNALRIMKKSTSFEVMRQFANGIFMSKLSYGAETWVGAPQFLVSKLQHLQLEAARICNGPKSRYWNKSTLLKSMNWIDVRSTAQFSAAKTIHQIL